MAELRCYDPDHGGALSGAEVGELTGALHAAAGNGGGGVTPSEAAVDAATAALTSADVMGRVLQAAYDVDHSCGRYCLHTETCGNRGPS